MTRTFIIALFSFVIFIAVAFPARAECLSLTDYRERYVRFDSNQCIMETKNGQRVLLIPFDEVVKEKLKNSIPFFQYIPAAYSRSA